jgi:hypothetical protein
MMTPAVSRLVSLLVVAGATLEQIADAMSDTAPTRDVGLLDVLHRLALALGESDFLALVTLAERHLDSPELAHRVAALPDAAASRAGTAVALVQHWLDCYDDADRGPLLRRLLGARTAVLN